ncbi:MAG: DUF2294 family protein [Chitinivibrionales bacterium]|nr:DUF2294 family protein [Chitinivibrionales bacterium]MBD3394871.1 DUF2294 family protein [Chitinivibrionales bacterium]
MSKQILGDEILDRLASDVKQFANDLLGLHPSSVFADAHAGSITVTMNDVLADAERLGAKDRRVAELIVRNHTASFKAVSGILHTHCAAVARRPVESSSFFIDPESNCATIILLFGNQSSNQHEC